MKEQRKFALDVGVTFIATAINLLIGFAITVSLGRYLGAGDLGLYHMASTIYGIAMLFAGIGIPAVMIKYVAEYRKERNKSNEIISSGVITSFLLGIGFSVLFYFLSGIFEGIFHMQGLSNLLKILSLVFPFALVGAALLGLLNGRREMKKYSIAIIIQAVLMLFISLLSIYIGYGVPGLMGGIVLSSLVSCLYLVSVTRSYFEISFENYFQTTKKMLIFGAQIFGTNAINRINYQADIIIIGYFLTAADVGYYGVASGFSKFFWIIPQAIQTITYPATAVYWKNNYNSALQTMIDKSMKYTACLLFPIGLGMVFFAKEIITMMFGGGFVSSVLPLQILIVGTVIFGLIKAIGGSVTAVGRPDLGLKVVGVSAAVNIALNILLIPYFGISGAAIATVISLSINALLIIILTIKILKIKIDFQWYAKIFGVTFLAILVFNYLGFVERYLVGTLILLIYVFIIFALFLTKRDKKYFKDLIQNIGE